MSYKGFYQETIKLIDFMDEIKKDLLKGTAGSGRAARRARVKLVELEKIGKEYRKLSVQALKEMKLEDDSKENNV